MSGSPVDRVRAWLANRSHSRSAIIAPYVKDGETYFLTAHDIAWVLEQAEVTGAEERIQMLLEALTISQTKLAELENALAWHTTCLSCATVLESSIADTERAEKAEAELAALKSRVDDTWPVEYCGHCKRTHQECRC